ncbi:MAG: hypothetical protein ABI905_18375 [Betaproteobacteria bacterium]
MLNRKSRLARLLWGIAGLLRAFPLVAAVCVAIGVFAVYSAVNGGIQLSGPLYSPAAHATVVTFTLLSALVVPIVVCGIWACRRFVSVMVTQNFGLCTGMRSRDQQDEPTALTEWLHDLFQCVAGKPAGPPLTFGDLRQVAFAETPQVDGIVLRMMTTCLTGGRPYTMPIEEDCFYFNPEELRVYFPGDVIAWLTDPARKRQNIAMHEQTGAGANSRTNSPCDQDPSLLALPIGDELPVILGVRMSLCFPILLSAIPLYRNSLRRVKPGKPGEEPAWERYVERVLFTDGGVCSNLPIHLFDAPLPAWPTFAINLRDDFDSSWESVEDRAVRPKRGQGFAGDSNPIPHKNELGSVIAFLAAIVTTMQNWRDVLQRSAGGSRDRVVTVRHTGEEGGLNLDMDQDAITRMATSGKLAASKLIDGFCPSPRSPQLNDDWTYHRWVRLRIQLRAMDEQIRKLGKNVTSLHNQPTVPDLLNHPAPYVGDSYAMDAPDRAAARQFLEELTRVESAMDALQHDFQKHSPKPGSDLRVTPRF